MQSDIYNRMRLVLIALLCFSAPLFSFGQVKTSLFGPDSLPFLFCIDQITINQVPCTDITVPSQSLGKHILQVTLPGDRVIQQNVIWKSAGTYIYEIKEVKGVLKIALNSESILTVTPTPSAPPAPAVTQVDSIPPAPPVYSGNIGCSDPLKDATFEELLHQSTSQTFESRRTAWWLSQLGPHCLKVNQLEAVLSDVELEENRLQLLDNLVSHTYDRDNLSSLLPLFLLEKNKQKAQSMISR